jgi:hypothetical protein
LPVRPARHGSRNKRIDMSKDNIIFYRQWWETIRELTPEQQSCAYDALLRFAFDGVEPTDAIARAVTTTMRSTILRDREKYERVCERNRANGKRGGAPRGNDNARKERIEKTTQNNPKQPKTTHSVVLNDTEPESTDIITVQPDTKEIEPMITTDETASSHAEIRQMFEEFRLAYPGTKRGFQTEYDNFKRKNTRYREIVPMLMPALNRLKQYHEQCAAAGRFCPNYKNLSTWINQRCWEEVLPPIIETKTSLSQNGSTEINHEHNDRRTEFARHIVDKLAAPDLPEPDISDFY